MNMHPLRRTSLAIRIVALALALAWTAQASSSLAQGRDVVVFAAASLKNALDEIAGAWERDTGKTVRISYAASNVLAKQIEAGAPADLFLSADLDWMDDLAFKDRIQTDTRADLLGNRLVLVAPKGAPEIAIQPGFDLAKALGRQGHLAMGNVDAVPAGKYGKAALEKLGIWESLKARVVQAESVRAALLLVSRGEAPLGIVYRTDAAADPNVAIVGTFPDGSHPPVIYPVALTKAAAHPDARAFLTFLRSGQAKPFFEKQGFTVIEKPVSGS